MRCVSAVLASLRRDRGRRRSAVAATARLWPSESCLRDWARAQHRPPWAMRSGDHGLGHQPLAPSPSRAAVSSSRHRRFAVIGKPSMRLHPDRTIGGRGCSPAAGRSGGTPQSRMTERFHWRNAALRVTPSRPAAGSVGRRGAVTAQSRTRRYPAIWRERRAPHHQMPDAAAPRCNPSKNPTQAQLAKSRDLHRGHADGLVHIDGDEARNAGLVHGDADQLRGQFHGALVVRDEDELHARSTSRARCRRSVRRCSRRAAHRPRPAGRTEPDSNRRSRTPARPRSAPSRRPTAG